MSDIETPFDKWKATLDTTQWLQCPEGPTRMAFEAGYAAALARQAPDAEPERAGAREVAEEMWQRLGGNLYYGNDLAVSHRGFVDALEQLITRALSAAVAAEREACAKIVEDKATDEAIMVLCIDALEVDNPTGKRYAGIMVNELLKVAAAIRARAPGDEEKTLPNWKDLRGILADDKAGGEEQGGGDGNGS